MAQQGFCVKIPVPSKCFEGNFESLSPILFVVVATYVANELMGSSLGHCFVGALAGVQVVATVVALSKGLGVGRATHGSIEVDATVEDG